MLDVDETGALRLENAAGGVERFTAGEVSIQSPGVMARQL